MENQDLIKFRQNFVFNLPKDLHDKFMQIPNRTELLTQLIKNYFDENIISVKLDSHTKEMLEKDIYKDFRIPMLLMEFYSKGNITSVMNNNVITSNQYNNENSKIEKEETPLTNSKQVIINNKSEELQNNDSSNNRQNETEVDIIASKIIDNNYNEDTNVNEGNNIESNENYANTKLQRNRENNKEKVPEGSTGSIKSMFKNQSRLKNNKDLI